jgi:hypothetical protein
MGNWKVGMVTPGAVAGLERRGISRQAFVSSQMEIETIRGIEVVSGK